VALRFYSRLFVIAPELRQMFPLSMAIQRDRLVTALGISVSHVDDLDRLVPYLQQLGRDHRRFGTIAEHYEPVGEALLATLGDFLGREWSLDLAQDWADAYNLVATTMINAAEEAARYSPPLWSAEVVGHERRTFDIAVLTIRPDQHFEYLPGQSMALQTTLRPRLWRYFSPANAPRHDGTIELHVRRIPGGPVSSALVDMAQKGDIVHLGAPVGHRLTLGTAGRADLLMIASGTGLAPLKGVIEQVADETAVGAPPRRVALFVGARTSRELYDLESLRAMDNQHPWLSVTPVLACGSPRPVTNPAGYGGAGGAGGGAPAGAPGAGSGGGTVAEVALRRHGWRDSHHVFACGNDAMVSATVQLLARTGCPPERMHYEGFQGLGGQTFGYVDTRGFAEQ
jgi:NAD(P)H-flavin reductase/hemoglobin-like flavoprotein